MLINKIIIGIKGFIFLHRECGVSYFQIFRSLSKKDKIVTIPIKNLPVTMNIRKALLFGAYLWNIEKYGWKIVDSSNDLVIYENEQNNIKLHTRVNDEWPYSATIYEVFVEEVYNADFANKIVIDVGAYRGESAIYFAINGAKKVIALEPDEENYKLALMNVKENKLENKIVLLNKALAPKEGIVSFYKYLYSSNASSIDPNNMVKLDDKLVVQQVEATTLNKIVKMVGGERVGLLKLDCEGCEYGVLNSFYDYDMIDNIILEYHNGLQNLPSLLESQGFEVTIKKANEKYGIIKALKSITN